MRSPLTACLLAFLITLAGEVGGETLRMNGVSSSVPLIISEGGSSKTCAVSLVSIDGNLNNIRQAVVSRLSMNTSGCFATQQTATTGFYVPSITTTLSSTMRVAVRRLSGTSSLNVSWSAPGLSPSSGSLYWAAGDVRDKYITFLATKIGTFKVSVPGAELIVTIQ